MAGYLTGNEDNGANLDFWNWRAVWDKDGLRLGIGQVYVDDKSVPGYDNWVRSAVTAGYDFDGVHLGATYEDYDRNGFGDRQNYGVVASYTVDGWTVGAGYFNRDFKDSNSSDNTGAVLSIKKQIYEDLLMFAECGDFDVNGQSSTTIGAKILF